MKNLFAQQKGALLVEVLVFSSIAIFLLAGLIMQTVVASRYSDTIYYREQAFQISEAGIEYYRWHLAYAATDYTDGTTTPAPYVHKFFDKNGNVIGAFSLTITPPPTGSSIVTVQSTGTVLADPSIAREIQVKYAIPSLAQYAYVTNSIVYYGAGDNVTGPVQSNAGVGFWNGSPEPIAHNTVTSAASSFTDTSSTSNCPGTHFGVYTCVPGTGYPNGDPTPTSTASVAPSRPDVFVGGRNFPVPAVDFNGITANLSQIQSSAESNGFYRGASGANGYEVVLGTGSTFQLYKVNSLLSPGSCSNSYPGGQTGWGTWSVNSTTLLGTYSYPANGLMFFGDNIWVQGQINKQRLTIAVGTFPDNVNTRKNIIVNNNLTYTNFDGSDELALIAQNNFIVGMASANNLTIDGAIVAQEGQTLRYYYTCSPYAVLSTLTTYGMFASNGQGYFAYGSGGVVSGYQNQPAAYDLNLLYGPPPSFPLTSAQYQIISWQELK